MWNSKSSQTVECIQVTDQFFTDQWKDHVPTWFLDHQKRFVFDLKERTVSCQRFENSGQKFVAKVGDYILRSLPSQEQMLPGVQYAEVFEITEHVFAKQWYLRTPWWFIERCEEGMCTRNINNKTVQWKFDGKVLVKEIGDLICVFYE